MLLTDRDDIRVAETDDEILIFDVSDDALGRAAPIIGAFTISDLVREKLVGVAGFGAGTSYNGR